MAAELKDKLNVEAELVIGSSGEFTVWVGDKKVSEKKWMFPSPDDVVAAVRSAMQAPS